MTLANLSDDEFSLKLSKTLGNDIGWRPYVEEGTIDRTRDALDILGARLDGQLLRYGGEDGDQEWIARAVGLRKLISSRTREVSRRIWRRDGSHTQRERDWKAFAHELCEIIEDSDLANELKTMDAPFGNITAQEWVERRREKRAEKAAA